MEIIKIGKYTNQEVIDNIKGKFGDIYEYDAVNYESSFIPVKLKCKKHGIFNFIHRDYKKSHGYNLVVMWEYDWIMINKFKDKNENI